MPKVNVIWICLLEHISCKIYYARKVNFGQILLADWLRPLIYLTTNMVYWGPFSVTLETHWDVTCSEHLPRLYMLLNYQYSYETTPTTTILNSFP
jgi:hypothetical protein